MPLFPFDKMQLAHYEKKIRRIQDHVYRKICSLKDIRYFAGERPGAEQPEFDDQDWQSFSIGQAWGGRDTLCWFRIPFSVPAECTWQNLALLVLPGKRFIFKSSEGGDLREYELMIYLDGRPLQSIDVRRLEIPLQDLVHPGENHLLAIEAFSGLEAHQHVFAQVDLAAIDGEVEEFYYNAKNVFDTLVAIGETDNEYAHVSQVLRNALLQVNFLHAGSPAFHQSIQEANSLLRQGLEQSKSRSARSPMVVSLGHSHLDLAWKWQIKHSIRKAARTCANALRLGDLYPEYRYTQSQAQLYKWVQLYYPTLFAGIKEKIRSGQWEATGGMWVESDCNIPGGESLLRQFLFGKRYFRQELGCDPQVVWLPDCFGFCYSLPQIMKHCGMNYFVTTKLSWNEYTRFPHDTFLWEGVDGTRILCHFITTPDRRGWNDYSVDLTAANVKACWDNYHQKPLNHEVLLSFGWGDGGGGPTREMLENGQRLENMAGLPRHRQGQAEAFFRDLEQRVQDLPVWNDELYLQLHRGTYTSQAKIKKQNRDSEILLHNIELFCTVAMLSGCDYPDRLINEIWETVLLNQFHDILPGSSIAEVYQDCDRDYEQIQRNGTALLDKALTHIGSHALAAGTGRNLMVFNSLSWSRSDVLTLPTNDNISAVRDEQNQLLPTQVSHDGRDILIAMSEIPALGYRSFSLEDKQVESAWSASLKISHTQLENRFFRIQLDDHGLILSLYDKRYQREIIPPGKRANVLQAFEDMPLANNAWDIDIFYLDKVQELTTLEQIKVVEQGPIRGGVKLRRKFHSSTIEQCIYIYDSIPRIDFQTEIDWQEHQVLLKAAFPVNVHAGRATYEIPFGSIERPTHWNTDWDKARYEVAAQKWADLSEADYGVSLLNTCKYGYDIKDNLMRLTLIKSAIDPDPNADIGHHRFCYALYPHRGDWRQGETAKRAYELNYDLLGKAVPGAEAVFPAFSFVQVAAGNVFIETIKKAEDSNRIAVRAYETFNQRGPVEFLFHNTLACAAIANGLEEEVERLKTDGNKVIAHFMPFEIKTLLIEFEK